LDLNGQPVPTTYTQYSVNFTAADTSTDVTFVFRHDPGYFGFDDASVTLFGGGSNLISNGGFETGDTTNWTYFNQNNVSFAGSVGTTPTQNLNANSGTYFWVDGATQGYDGLTQTIATTIGSTYTISFYLNQYDTNGHAGVTTPITNFQALSTNGQVGDPGQDGTAGNGVDLLVYAGAVPSTIPPAPVPEPEIYAMFGIGLGLMGWVGRRRKQQAA